MSNRNSNRKKLKGKKPKRARRRSSVPALSPNGIDHPIEASVETYREFGLDEDDAQDLAMQMHPNIQENYSYDRLPEEVEGGEGAWSPRLHISMHAILEKQLALNEPEGIVDIAIALEKEGVIGTHQIRHAILDSFANVLWQSQRDRVPFDSQAYLDGIPEAYKGFCDALA